MDKSEQCRNAVWSGMKTMVLMIYKMSEKISFLLNYLYLKFWMYEFMNIMKFSVEILSPPCDKRIKNGMINM